MPRNRPFIAADNVGRTCSCLDCQMAEVTHLPTMKVPPDDFHPKSRWLHGAELKSYHEARDTAMGALAGLRAKLSPKPKPKPEGD